MKGTGGEGRGGDATMSRHTFPTPLLGGIPVTQPTVSKYRMELEVLTACMENQPLA